MELIKLQSSEGEIFQVDFAVIKCSGTICTILEDMDSDEIVSLPNVSSAILRKVIEFCEYHKDDPIPPSRAVDDDAMDDIILWDIIPWASAFLEVGQRTLFELVIAADYLEIRSLLDVTCKTFANMVKGKTPDELRQTFNIVNDFSAAEEEQTRMKNSRRVQ